MQETLGRRLRLMRAERGFSLREASRRAGVAKETISEIERGHTHPYDVTLAKLARAYDVPVGDLLEEPGGKASAPPEPGRTVYRFREDFEDVTLEDARALGIDLNGSELIVLNQLLHAYYYPPEGVYAVGYVKREGEVISRARVRTAYAAILAAKELPQEMEAADARLEELVPA
jgi:transcriptional regulator with XRE-family HTH domain